MFRGTEAEPEFEGSYECWEEGRKGHLKNVLMPDCVALYSYGKCALHQKPDGGNQIRERWTNTIVALNCRGNDWSSGNPRALPPP